jgi:hypothetical protein
MELLSFLNILSFFKFGGQVTFRDIARSATSLSPDHARTAKLSVEEIITD